jgi:hypothetical protein
MGLIHQELSEQFYTWERRGRGWRVFDEPVSPEPPFRPFYGHYLPQMPIIDDGRRPTFLSSFVQKLSQKLSTQLAPHPVEPVPEEEPEPMPLIRDSLVELQTSLPADLDIKPEAFAAFFSQLSNCSEPVVFELLGMSKRVVAQFAAGPADAPHVRRQLQAYFPDVFFQMREGTLEKAWNDTDGDQALVVEFGLEREFMFPLAQGKLDPFIGIIGALSELQSNELGLFQVIFQSAQHPWFESITRSVAHSDGKPFFVNAPELARAAEDKVSRPLYAAVVRIAAKSERYERTIEIACDLAASLRVFAHPQGNALIPLSNDGYPPEEHVQDLLRRQSRRSGMLLNSDELIGFVHIPSSAVRSPALLRETGKTKAAPENVRQSGVLLGYNVHAGESVCVRLTPDERMRHCHIIGASGTGKSTLMFNMIKEDIENGEGLAVLDPHGDLIEQILEIIPPGRTGDVILVDPSDEGYSVGFNILSAHSDLEKNLLASDLVSVFQRLSSSWGDQMGSVLRNAILAFLESNQGGTLSDLRRFLIEPAYRERFLDTVLDPDIVYYWKKAFTQLSGNKSIGPVLTRLDTFLSPKPIRYMVSQTVNRLDFSEIMDSGKIFLAKLPQGQIGKENSFLLGSLLVAKFQQLVMGRQATRLESRRPFYLYIDEFSNFITPSMAEILSGARKYRLGLVLAHQELRQLERDREVFSAVLANSYTRIVLRVGDSDARALESGFSFFKAQDLQNLETGQAITRVEKASGDFNLSIPLPEKIDSAQAEATKQAVIAASRARYGTPRVEIEAALLAKLDAEERKPEPPKARPPVSKPVLEKRLPEPKADKVAERKAPTVPADLGRGGAQHQAIQQRLKKAAEELGFRATIEKPTPDGQGSVDLLVERADSSIACEISVTTTIDHEVGNISKCLKAGHLTVAVICVEAERLKRIEAAVSGSLGPEFSGRVRYLRPEEFIEHLKTLPQPTEAASETVHTRRGYKVKRSHPELSPEERKQKEEAAIRAIAEAMHRPKKDS